MGTVYFQTKLSEGNILPFLSRTLKCFFFENQALCFLKRQWKSRQSIISRYFSVVLQIVALLKCDLFYFILLAVKLLVLLKD